MILTELLYVAILPLAVAAIMAFLAQPLRLSPPIAWATAVGTAYIIGQLGLGSRRGDALATLLHPREASDWLPLAVLLALVATVVAYRVPHPWHRLGYALAVALTIGLPVRSLSGSVYDLEWTLLEKTACIAVLSAALGLMWVVLASARETDHPRLRPVLLIIVASGAAVVATLSGVFVYGELCGVVAAALTGAFLVLRTPNVAGTAGVVTFSLGSLILLSCFYAELNAAGAALLFLATMFAAGPTPAFMSSRPAWLRITLRITLTLLPLAMALAHALAATQTDATSSDPYSI